ncbi:formylglycine-generating sulfatase, putative [Bodo saltans]|uniref:Formylglycine-generating sulfatase, putative n=1 Tax=Bodo saltans TaxID=75058 RepID=A0A0S4JIK4_BODSA|nr:formylglycine-generating sulfatase, putative [Bodo saltans]|eukprot:CUG90380.1 formylglycine-generating sulfatase, putative [Bodo saltans]
MTQLPFTHLTHEQATVRYGLDPDRNLFKTTTPQVCCGEQFQKKEEIRQYVHATMEVYEKVFECLNSTESFLIQPVHKLRHPLIFYYGHTATFFINKLVVAGLTTRVNPAFEEMFAVGVDEMSWDDLNDAHYNWPTIAEVSAYRLAVRDRLDALMRESKFELNLPLTFASSTQEDANSLWWVMLMGAEHERIHLETASVHVRELPMHLVLPEMASFWTRCPESNDAAPTNEMIEVDGGSVEVGRATDSSVYGWDCDYAVGGNKHAVAPFKASKFLVSNAEFFAFVKADGYRRQEFWDAEGWSWVEWKKPQHPWFWVRDDSRVNGYALRLQTELIDLPWNWPVEVNHLEARAFCTFKGQATGKKLRLPTEAEWLLLRDRYVKQDQFEWGNAPGNVNLEHYRSSCPVDKFANGPFFDIVGNVWQHTETPVYPYPGFAVHPYYDDFSMPTFDGRHYCMKGGAWVSTGNEATRDARFAFRRHFFQFIGIRYVDGSDVNETSHLRNVLGMDPEVDAVTDFGFRASFGPVGNASETLAKTAAALFAKHAKVPARRALDLACGAGRVSFELTETFETVIGSDLTARRLIPAFALRERGSASYSVVDENGQRVARAVDASAFPWNGTRERAYFYQADPANMHGHMSNFDLIVAWNVLERSYRPTAIPAHLLSRLNRGGMLIIGGHFEFNETLSARETWITGNKQDALVALLGGAAAVEVVGEPIVLHAAYPESETSAEVKRVTLVAIIKK